MSKGARGSSELLASEHPVLLTDVSDIKQLLSYAATGQVAYMDSGWAPGGKQWTQNELAGDWRSFKLVAGRMRRKHAARADKDGEKQPKGSPSSNFSRSLRNPTIGFLQDLDAVLLRKVPTLSRAGGLAAFSARLTGRRGAENFGFEVDPLNRPLVLELIAPPPIIVLEQATILLAEFEEVPGDAASVVVTHQDAFPRIVKNLIRIGGLPPTPYSVDALFLLGELSRYAFGSVQEHLYRALRTPLGFRVWRAVTAIVMAIKQHKEENAAWIQPVREWVKGQLEVSSRLRSESLYAARSLDLELAIEVPLAWSSPDGPGTDWAANLLRERANDPEATLRERGTAAFGLWERAVRGNYLDAARPEMEELIQAFHAEGHQRPGLRWVAVTLQENVNARRDILTTWPNLDEPCQQVLQQAGESLTDVPPRIRDATRTLLDHAVIKNAGVYRRRAIDTLRAGAWGGQVLPALEAVLNHPRAEPWLRCRALFAIGFMQNRSDSAVSTLHSACVAAWRRLRSGPGDDRTSRSRVAELHAALFAVGDCFGTPDGQAAAEQIRDRLDDLLNEILGAVIEDAGRRLIPVGRALAYLLATTAQVKPRETHGMLERLAEVADLSTRQMCRWGLQRLERFKDNIVKSAHEVEFGTVQEA